MIQLLQQERHNQILAKLNLEGQVRVKELSQAFHVTEDCIRKDLTILEKDGQLKRIHGGAMQVRKNLHAINVIERIDKYVVEKKLIAQKAVKLIEPGTMIFLGISTVNLEIAKLIYQMDLHITVVTNMIDIMEIFKGDCKTLLIFIGGTFNRARDGFIGSMTIDLLKSLSALVMKNTGQEYKTALGDFSSAKGDLRLLNVTAGVGGKSYMNYSKVPVKLAEFCNWLNQERKNYASKSVAQLYELSFDTHYHLVTIHPWADGNGRMARLVMNMLQFEFGLIPTKILKDDEKLITV